MFKLVPNRPLIKSDKSIRSEEVFDQFFDSFFNSSGLTEVNNDQLVRDFTVDVIDRGDHYIIEAELPGFSQGQVIVDYEQQHLTIAASRVQATQQHKDEWYIRKERHYGEFKRSFFVDNIDASTIRTGFNNGILTISLKKLPLKSKFKGIVLD